MIRSRHPFDAEHQRILPRDFVYDGRGRVYQVSGWYATSFQIEGQEWRWTMRRGWEKRGDPLVIGDPVTMLKTVLATTPMRPDERKRQFYDRYHNGVAAEITRQNIASHRAEVKRVGLRRDDVR